MLLTPTPFRIQPRGAVHLYRTFSATNPRSTHTRPASCEEIDCQHFLTGWNTVVDEGTELGARQAHYIRHDRSRSHREHQDPDLGGTVFFFPPGQRCFRADQHRVSLFRPPILTTRRGDWRGSPDNWCRRFVRPEDWVDDFATHTDQIAERRRRG